MRVHVIFFLFIIIIMSVSSCNKTNRKADISEIDLELTIHRLDKDLFDVDFDTLNRHCVFLQKKYGDFFTLYTRNIINIGHPDNKAFPVYLKDFLTNDYIQKAYNKAKEQYSDISEEEETLINAFKRYKYFFPEKKVPGLYTVISGFNESVIVGEESVGIALDKYLGKDCVFYKRLGWPVYLIKDMTRDMLCRDVMQSWGLTEWVFSDSVTDNVVNNMLYNGKIHYFVKMTLPELPEHLVFGFTEDELKFCRNNEEQMWTYLIEHKILFSTDFMDIRRYTSKSPFTPGFPNESPGRAANWIGYLIIESYMKNNSDVTVEQLMDNEDYQQIMNKSKYKP